jgi:hypothetical protein
MMFEQVYGEGSVEVKTYGNVFAAKTFLDGIAVEDIPDIHLLDETDKDYQLTIGIRAVKK